MRRIFAPAAIFFVSAFIVLSFLSISPASACSDPNGHYRCGGGGFTGRTDFNVSMEAISPPRVLAPRKAKRVAALHSHKIKTKRLPASPRAKPGLSHDGGFYLVSKARAYMGMTAAQIGLSRKTLWCATFIAEAVAPHVRAKVRNPNMARDYAALPRVAPHPGALVVLTRGKRGGHIGVMTGVAPNGDPIIVSGNHNRRVGEARYSRHRVIAYVSAS